MKRSEISLRNMPNIVATCIVLYNLCIMNNEGIEKDHIVKEKYKLAIKIIDEKLQERSELRGKKMGLAEVKRRILVMDDVLIPDEINDIET